MTIRFGSSAEVKQLTAENADLREQLRAARAGPTSYAWEGEDVLASKILRDRFGIEKGFYVDVGAHHPVNLSNTFYFYNRGWRGINIDAMPGSMIPFRQYRPEDVNIEAGIALETSTRTFVRFTEPELNGFLSDADVQGHVRGGRTVVGRSQVNCMPLTTVLDQHNVRPDFDLLNVDVEGLDLEVLMSLDFDRYHPKLVIAEVLGCDKVADALASPIVDAMKMRGYDFYSRLDFSVIFLKASR